MHIHPKAQSALRTSVVALAALLAGAASAADPANLIVNGSLEQNNYFIERDGFPRVDDLNGSTPIGWTRDTGDLAEYFTRVPAYAGVTIYNTADGDYFIGAHDGEWWEQSFATVAGTEYTLSYASAYGAAWWSTFYYRPGTLAGEVTLTGTALLASTVLDGAAPAPTGTTLLDAPFVWSRQTLRFVADSAVTRLRFAGSTVPNGGFVFVDDVSVTAATAVPEPQARWMLMLGLPGVWLAGRARQRRLRASS